jgi:hypothetical protein
MKFYEVITSAFANEVTAWNDLPDFLCTLWLFVKVTDLIREALLFFMCMEESIRWFNSSALVLDFTSYIPRGV